VTALFIAEGVTKTELLAIRFGTPENATLFKVCVIADCERSRSSHVDSRRNISARLRKSTKLLAARPLVALLFPAQPQPRPKKKQSKSPRLEEHVNLRPSYYDPVKTNTIIVLLSIFM